DRVVCGRSERNQFTIGVVHDLSEDVLRGISNEGDVIPLARFHRVVRCVGLRPAAARGGMVSTAEEAATTPKLDEVVRPPEYFLSRFDDEARYPTPVLIGLAEREHVDPALDRPITIEVERVTMRNGHIGGISLGIVVEAECLPQAEGGIGDE